MSSQHAQLIRSAKAATAAMNCVLAGPIERMLFNSVIGDEELERGEVRSTIDRYFSPPTDAYWRSKRRDWLRDAVNAGGKQAEMQEVVSLLDPTRLPVILSGENDRELEGDPSFGQSDSFIAKFDKVAVGLTKAPTSVSIEARFKGTCFSVTRTFIADNGAVNCDLCLEAVTKLRSAILKASVPGARLPNTEELTRRTQTADRVVHFVSYALYCTQDTQTESDTLEPSAGGMTDAYGQVIIQVAPQRRSLIAVRWRLSVSTNESDRVDLFGEDLMEIRFSSTAYLLELGAPLVLPKTRTMSRSPLFIGCAYASRSEDGHILNQNGANVFCTETEVAKHPALTRAFSQALADAVDDGLRWMMEDVAGFSAEEVAYLLMKTKGEDATAPRRPLRVFSQYLFGLLLPHRRTLSPQYDKYRKVSERYGWLSKAQKKLLDEKWRDAHVVESSPKWPQDVEVLKDSVAVMARIFEVSKKEVIDMLLAWGEKKHSVAFSAETITHEDGHALSRLATDPKRYLFLVLVEFYSGRTAIHHRSESDVTTRVKLWCLLAARIWGYRALATFEAGQGSQSKEMGLIHMSNVDHRRVARQAWSVAGKTLLEKTGFANIDPDDWAAWASLFRGSNREMTKDRIAYSNKWKKIIGHLDAVFSDVFFREFNRRMGWSAEQRTSQSGALGLYRCNIDDMRATPFQEARKSHCSLKARVLLDEEVDQMAEIFFVLGHPGLTDFRIKMLWYEFIRDNLFPFSTIAYLMGLVTRKRVHLVDYIKRLHELHDDPMSATGLSTHLAHFDEEQVKTFTESYEAMRCERDDEDEDDVEDLDV